MTHAALRTILPLAGWSDEAARAVDITGPLDPILPTVEKPGRYIGLERNVTRKDLPSAAVTLAPASDPFVERAKRLMRMAKALAKKKK